MRHFMFKVLTVPAASVLAATLAFTIPAPAQDQAAEPAKTMPDETVDPIDRLFAELKRESDADEAERISRRIWALWRDSGSATANLLMQWADKAVADKNNSLALDLLDQVVVLMPDFAEGWNRRATLHYAMGNHAKSMADINRVLSLEPRHFGAMAGMAAILDAAGNDALALRAWEQMLRVYPANHQAQDKVGELADKLAGSKT
jgi:tetratricopeptide (TPR) repeat protein